MRPFITADLHDPVTNPTQESWLVDRLIPHESVTVLAARPKSGKTVLTTALATSVATGQPFLGQPTRQGPVLWFAAEESREERRSILNVIPYAKGPHPLPVTGANPPSDLALPIYTAYSPLIIGDHDYMFELSELIAEIKPVLLVLDPLISMTGKKDLGAARSARQIIEGLRVIASTYKLAVITLHQVSSSVLNRRCANSVQIEAAASNIWLMETFMQARRRNIRLDLRGRGPFANQSLFLESPQLGVYELQRVGTYTPQVPRVEDLVLEAITDQPKTAKQIAQETELKHSSVQNALTKLRYAGLVDAIIKRGRQSSYLTPQCPERPEP